MYGNLEQNIHLHFCKIRCNFGVCVSHFPDLRKGQWETTVHSNNGGNRSSYNSQPLCGYALNQHLLDNKLSFM